MMQRHLHWYMPFTPKQNYAVPGRHLQTTTTPARCGKNQSTPNSTIGDCMQCATSHEAAQTSYRAHCRALKAAAALKAQAACAGRAESTAGGKAQAHHALCACPGKQDSGSAFYFRLQRCLTGG